MPININLLVSAPVLQNFLVDDATGLPLVAGIVSMYTDNSRTTFKNWYYQTGTASNPQFLPLSNPLTLGAAGEIVDPNGNDTWPFYYPYSEDPNDPPGTPQPYYVVVTNSLLQAEFTRQNFPFIPTSSSPGSQTPNLKSLIVNKSFWRNFGSQTLNASNAEFVANTVSINGITLNYATLCPSQHDGFTMRDIQFFKNTTDAVDVVTFKNFVTNFSDQITGPNDVTPEYYLNFNCTGAGTDTQKYIQIPICLHVDNLSGYTTASMTLDAMAVTGNPIIKLKLFQFLGTGATSANALTTQTITLNNSWTKYTATFSFITSQSLTLGVGGDDAWYMLVSLPVGAAGVANINIANPGLYLSSNPPTNDFETYDASHAVFDSARTGDVRMSLNKFSLSGWVQCNDGVLSNSGSITPPAAIPVARANIDTWRLFDTIWRNTNVAVAPIFDSAGAASTKGATSIADWTANKQLQLTLTLGRSLLGLPPVDSVTYDRATTPAWSTVAGVFSVTVGSNALLYVGAPVYLTGTMPAGGNFVANTVYYAIPPIDASSTTTFQVATTYANALAGTAIAAGAAANNGTSLVVNFALGGAFGQARHVQLEKELATHSHPGSTVSGSDAAPLAGANNATTNNGHINDVPLTIAPDGLSHPFNVIQPSVYMNIFLKL